VIQGANQEELSIIDFAGAVTTRDLTYIDNTIPQAALTDTSITYAKMAKYIKDILVYDKHSSLYKTGINQMNADAPIHSQYTT
jgi:hypothetical protein